MRSLSKKLIAVVAAVLASVVFSSGNIYADGEGATSISISPVSKVLQLSPNSVYEDTFTITNNGSNSMDFEAYAAPYSYTFSEEDNAYRLGFSRESNYTQITRWITFRDASGNYVEKATFTAEPNSEVEVAYRISTPESIPAGGQYAVLFAHTLSGTTDSTGIKTEASPGLVVYGRGDGETIVGSEVSDLNIAQTLNENGSERSVINASAKVKNTGNVDFMATGLLKVTNIFGGVYYESTGESSRSRISIIPDTELTVSDVWEETPFFGMFNVEWTVYVNGEATEDTITRFVVIMPTAVIIIVILLLTIVIVWIIIMLGKRRERRSKFMV